ncbi:hypothetical protein BaRGS_00028848 [Batillaria attramentaria]|uniref:Uncharacterized protein n=1 Tax=Batillaria attramentaria TaxID=370345 RepID=A0ABD0JZ06_9CAEN
MQNTWFRAVAVQTKLRCFKSYGVINVKIHRKCMRLMGKDYTAHAQLIAYARMRLPAPKKAAFPVTLCCSTTPFSVRVRGELSRFAQHAPKNVLQISAEKLIEVLVPQ